MFCLRKVILLSGFVFCLSALSAKEYGLGGGPSYNFGNKTLGLDLRGEIPIVPFGYTLLEGFTVVPQVSVYPISGQRREFYLGSSLHLAVYKLKKWKFYGLINLSYNGWVNYKESDLPDAKFSNVDFDFGAGVTTTSCVRPFMELRYHFKWTEPSIRIGYIYTFNCDRRGQVPCSKIPKLPVLQP